MFLEHRKDFLNGTIEIPSVQSSFPRFLELKPSTFKSLSDKNVFLNSHDFGERDEILSAFLSSWKGDSEKCEGSSRKRSFYNISSDEEYVEKFFSEVSHKGHFSKGRTFVFVDIETTSLDPLYGEIIEIGVVVKDHKGDTKEEFSSLYGVSPKDGPAEESIGKSEVHGISASDIVGLPLFWGDDFSKLQDLLCDDRVTVVAHNSDFEYLWLSLLLPGFYEAHTDDTGVPVNVLDTLMVSKVLFEGTPDNKLSTFAEGCNVPYENAHRAFPDALMTAESFFNFVKDFSKCGGRRSQFPLQP